MQIDYVKIALVVELVDTKDLKLIFHYKFFHPKEPGSTRNPKIIGNLDNYNYFTDHGSLKQRRNSYTPLTHQ